jgi:hypothetical protein
MLSISLLPVAVCSLCTTCLTVAPSRTDSRRRVTGWAGSTTGEGGPPDTGTEKGQLRPPPLAPPSPHPLAHPLAPPPRPPLILNFQLRI